MSGASVGEGEQKVIDAASGAGPLLQREYSGVIEGTSLSPEELAKLVRERFTDLAPRRPRPSHAPTASGRR